MRMDSLATDLRYALRQIRRRPLFTVVAAASLAIGVGLGYLMRSFLLGLSPVDPITLAGVAVALVAVVLLASVIPGDGPHRSIRWWR